MSVKVVANDHPYDFKLGYTWELSKDDRCLHILTDKNVVIAAFATWEAVYKNDS